MEAVKVLEVDVADRERAIAVQVMAFCADPVMRWLYPASRDYLEHFPSFAAAFGGLAFDHGTAYHGDGFSGVSLWLPVGVEVDPEPVVKLFQESLEPAVRDDAFGMLEEMGKYHIEEPHWYLPMIGVDPSRQGRGIGSALLGHALARCDELELPAYLESSNPANVPLYERHGFRVVTELQVDSSPTLYPMLRTPR